jgi:hypothetical protein
MIRYRRGRLGERLDRLLSTRPLFETLLFENSLSGADRIAVIAHTIRAVIRYRGEQVRLGVGEVVDTLLFRVLLRGRVPLRGMTAILRVGELVWYQVADWDVAQRVRRAFGRISMRDDCTVLFCGARHHAKRGEFLPVFVLLDATSRVLEIAYADKDETGVVGLWPGIGADFRTTPRWLLPTLQALVGELGIEAIDNQLDRFLE